MGPDSSPGHHFDGKKKTAVECEKLVWRPMIRLQASSQARTISLQARSATTGGTVGAEAAAWAARGLGPTRAAARSECRAGCIQRASGRQTQFIAETPKGVDARGRNAESLNRAALPSDFQFQKKPANRFSRRGAFNFLA